MKELKVGDRVRVLNDRKVHVGKVGKVTRIFGLETVIKYDVKFSEYCAGAYISQDLELIPEKIAVHCPTEELWDEVQEKALSEGLRWCYNPSKPKDYLDKAYYLSISGTYLLRGDMEDYRKDYKIITAEEYLKEGKMEFKVGDKVRIVGNDSSKGQEGEIIDGYKGNYSHLVFFLSGIRLPFQSEDLELIPTEEDIMVGSVWEHNTLPSIKREIIIVKDKIITLRDGVRLDWTFKNFLSLHKLISKPNQEVRTDFNLENIESASTDGTITLKQTNKKEKKMKTKVIAVNLEIIDKACDNIGKVVHFDPDGEVVYKEANGKLCIGQIENIYVSPVKVVMPKEKPVKKKRRN